MQLPNGVEVETSSSILKKHENIFKNPHWYIGRSCTNDALATIRDSLVYYEYTPPTRMDENIMHNNSDTWGRTSIDRMDTSGAVITDCLGRIEAVPHDGSELFIISKDYTGFFTSARVVMTKCSTALREYFLKNEFQFGTLYGHVATDKDCRVFDELSDRRVVFPGTESWRIIRQHEDEQTAKVLDDFRNVLVFEGRSEVSALLNFIIEDLCTGGDVLDVKTTRLVVTSFPAFGCVLRRVSMHKLSSKGSNTTMTWKGSMLPQAQHKFVKSIKDLIGDLGRTSVKFSDFMPEVEKVFGVLRDKFSSKFAGIADRHPSFWNRVIQLAPQGVFGTRPVCTIKEDVIPALPWPEKKKKVPFRRLRLPGDPKVEEEKKKEPEQEQTLAILEPLRTVLPPSYIPSLGRIGEHRSCFVGEFPVFTLPAVPLEDLDKITKCPDLSFVVVSGTTLQSELPGVLNEKMRTYQWYLDSKKEGRPLPVSGSPLYFVMSSGITEKSKNLFIVPPMGLSYDTVTFLLHNPFINLLLTHNSAFLKRRLEQLRRKRLAHPDSANEKVNVIVVLPVPTDACHAWLSPHRDHILKLCESLKFIEASEALTSVAVGLDYIEECRIHHKQLPTTQFEVRLARGRFGTPKAGARASRVPTFGAKGEVEYLELPPPDEEYDVEGIPPPVYESDSESAPLKHKQRQERESVEEGMEEGVLGGAGIPSVPRMTLKVRESVPPPGDIESPASTPRLCRGGTSDGEASAGDASAAEDDASPGDLEDEGEHVAPLAELEDAPEQCEDVASPEQCEDAASPEECGDAASPEECEDVASPAEPEEAGRVPSNMEMFIDPYSVEHIKKKEPKPRSNKEGKKLGKNVEKKTGKNVEKVKRKNSKKVAADVPMNAELETTPTLPMEDAKIKRETKKKARDSPRRSARIQEKSARHDGYSDQPREEAHVGSERIALQTTKQKSKRVQAEGVAGNTKDQVVSPPRVRTKRVKMARRQMDVVDVTSMKITEEYQKPVTRSRSKVLESGSVQGSDMQSLVCASPESQISKGKTKGDVPDRMTTRSQSRNGSVLNSQEGEAAVVLKLPKREPRLQPAQGPRPVRNCKIVRPVLRESLDISPDPHDEDYGKPKKGGTTPQFISAARKSRAGRTPTSQIDPSHSQSSPDAHNRDRPFRTCKVGRMILKEDEPPVATPPRRTWVTPSAKQAPSDSPPSGRSRKRTQHPCDAPESKRSKTNARWGATPPGGHLEVWSIPEKVESVDVRNITIRPREVVKRCTLRERSNDGMVLEFEYTQGIDDIYPLGADVHVEDISYTVMEGGARRTRPIKEPKRASIFRGPDLKEYLNETVMPDKKKRKKHAPSRSAEVQVQASDAPEEFWDSLPGMGPSQEDSAEVELPLRSHRGRTRRRRFLDIENLAEASDGSDEDYGTTNRKIKKKV